MHIILGADHAGFQLKQELVKFLKKLGVTYTDIGTYSTEVVDYPDIAREVAEETTEDKNNIGILICGTGIGMSIAANKLHGVRAALCHNEFTAKESREHDDANILVLGSETTNLNVAKRIVKIFLDTKFSEKDQYKRRLQKISALEKNRLGID